MSARRTAFNVLIKSEKLSQYSNIALDSALESSRLTDKDKALASALIYGVTERRITLDYYISRLSSRPIETLDKEALCALRLGLYQLIYMDKIPPHAAVNETVSLCRRSFSGFVNAILRSYMRLEAPIALPCKKNSFAEYLSVAYSVCPPLAEKFSVTFGAERAESLLSASFDTPRTTLRVNELKTSRDALLEHISNAEASMLSTVGIKMSGSVRDTYGFSDGLFFVQDEASQICVAAVGAKAGETIIDACSCPGSKSFGMAIDMNNSGEILAFDLHKSKLSLIDSGAKRLGIDIIKTAEADGRVQILNLVGKADRVLCDVPCSGYGVIAKKPEIRYKNPAECARLPDIQFAILENCAKYLKSGGTLVYSTCTVLPEENEMNIERFLANHPDFRLEGFDYFGRRCDSGMMTLYPDIDKTDGFFVAKAVKI